MAKVICKYYPEEHYQTLFNQETGLFIRQETDGFKEPFMSAHGPEIIDLSITNYCTKNCKICYRDSNQQGSFLSIKNLKSILKQAKQMDVHQIAIGGGNPNEHPLFGDILRLIREEYNIVPSFTTNGINLNSRILRSAKKYCGAVAISSMQIDNQFIKHLRLLIENRIKTNIHFVITKDSIKTAIRILEGKFSLPEGLNAIVFLNYKPVGKNKNTELLAKNSPDVKKFFHLISSVRQQYKIGFDSCLVSGIADYTDFNKNYFDSCEAGRFSAFIDENMNMLPCSFLIKKRIDPECSLLRNTMEYIWNHSKLFKSFRAKLKNNTCNCEHYDTCGGGCPIFDINLCRPKQT